ncbi:hypothetical protein [Polynucleobacter sp. AP-Melu-500A-A1]|uniref:hypothetical protein n=1 Tax=Polynucleobacter sp. AP-Melu-500A-A1 TaxID=2576929 RepID=UPI001C0DC2A3|nr:hypothetical protein [Polynucleobacter sp. AP-Melu-500A-A1]MBU3631154.1 hypothetical protein [Polynucleobacter sp. AP-Melu-500A-A1]
MSDFLLDPDSEWEDPFNDYLYLSGLNDLHEAFMYIKDYEDHDKEIKQELLMATLKEVGSIKVINSNSPAIAEEVPLLGYEFNKLYQDWYQYLGYLVDPKSNDQTELPNTRVLVDLAQSELTIAKLFNKKYLHFLDEGNELGWLAINGDSLSPFEDIEYSCEIWRMNATDAQLLLEHLHTKGRLESIIKSNQGLGPSPIYTSSTLLPDALMIGLGLAKLANANAMVANGDIEEMADSLYEASQVQKMVAKSLVRKRSDGEMREKFALYGGKGKAARMKKLDELRAYVIELALPFGNQSANSIAYEIQKPVLDKSEELGAKLSKFNVQRTIQNYILDYRKKYPFTP